MSTRLARLNEGYTRLAIAITKQAANDYKDEYEWAKRLGRPTKKLIELEEWFNSIDGNIITMGQGKKIMEHIQNNRPIKSMWEDDDI